MEERLVRTFVGELTSLLIAQVINLTISLCVCIVAALFVATCETRFLNPRRVAWLLEEEEEEENYCMCGIKWSKMSHMCCKCVKTAVC